MYTCIYLDICMSIPSLYLLYSIYIFLLSSYLFYLYLKYLFDVLYVLYLLYLLGLIDSICHIYQIYHILFLNPYPYPCLYLHPSISESVIYMSASVVSISTSCLQCGFYTNIQCLCISMKTYVIFMLSRMPKISASLNLLRKIVAWQQVLQVYVFLGSSFTK